MKLINRLMRWNKISTEEFHPTEIDQALTVIALGHTDADTAHILDPSVNSNSPWALQREDTVDWRSFTFSGPGVRPLRIIDLGASQPSEIQLANATAMIFVTDLEPYDQPAPPPELNHFKSMLARLAAVRSRAPELPLILFLRNAGPFRRKLDEVPLESCFPGEDHTPLEDESQVVSGAKLLARKIKETQPGPEPEEGSFHLHFIAGETSVEEITFIIEDFPKDPAGVRTDVSGGEGGKGTICGSTDFI
ncbi:hypothetical protein MCOR25_008290 [Pyricularia grisea]|uniref:Uncharacterized protein n=1 Tax=Pyricularia grisea TaxID=148305 RepID=A0A6P8B048_PYRGI|nr:uncharacterized protein PgNI_07212 [Pyricularia grisea]KAI6355219.1 hypothetical protein MCOR25_008290 [Pyricularia grisea]TLD08285.1 hypothetical protein PgNI_07212 [Pyricularia grisea]